MMGGVREGAVGRFCMWKCVKNLYYGVVDHGVDTSEGGENVFEHGVDFCGVGDVTVDGDCSRAASLQFFGKIFRRGSVHLVIDSHVVSRAGQPGNNCFADTRIGTGNECGKPGGHSTFLSSHASEMIATPILTPRWPYFEMIRTGQTTLGLDFQASLVTNLQSAAPSGANQLIERFGIHSRHDFACESRCDDDGEEQ